MKNDNSSAITPQLQGAAQAEISKAENCRDCVKKVRNCFLLVTARRDLDVFTKLREDLIHRDGGWNMQRPRYRTGVISADEIFPAFAVLILCHCYLVFHCFISS